MFVILFGDWVKIGAKSWFSLRARGITTWISIASELSPNHFSEPLVSRSGAIRAREEARQA
jgi:hypothetical protein